ncbi:hypothetical protein SCD_n02146 [Sulfuricella denitrificans skB26]|uniref:Uncharacterized protein n=1 Tax=Sulfuricella denitrificans (strain DSM 22764 / NBRC 105220 / skB26) TaxID=1163617 RepID=S6AAJ2_SULDS|nr:hypothetical protein SCD_n02146 [Sulfuricella denitrificans skB26]
MALAVSAPAFAKKPPTVQLNCIKLSDYKTEAERKYLDKASGGGDIYTVDITFIGKKPDNKTTDKVLRGCIDVAVKMDSNKDILGNAWFRKKAGANPYDDDQINLYGGMKYISYKAATKKVEVNDLLPLKKK